MPDPLRAVSPLDGRYTHLTSPLADFVSEGALIRARVHVEIEYLIALSALPETSFSLDPSDRSTLRHIHESFDEQDAQLVKQIETEGTKTYPATNHDVKAVEYFLREQLPDNLTYLFPWIHFGLTSEDVTNLAYRLLVKQAVTTVLRPHLDDVIATLTESAQDYRALPMLARTHGQPATPTTYGKELAVYASRLIRATNATETTTDHLRGKLAGASGTYAAHTVAFPDVDWMEFSRSFVESLGLDHEPIVTQINPGDDLAHLFDSLSRVNQVMIDLSEDMWLYISDQYLGQQSSDTETGSSTMPHKVNPIDFENAEGNLRKANNDFSFLAESITTSRLQRDLTDSTIKRNIGTALAHTLIGYEKLNAGIATVTPNETRMQNELAANPEILTEAIQTVLRREGHADAYEQVKALSRGQRLSIDELRDEIMNLEISQPVKDELLALTPETYTGLASDLVDSITDN